MNPEHNNNPQDPWPRTIEPPQPQAHYQPPTAYSPQAGAPLPPDLPPPTVTPPKKQRRFTNRSSILSTLILLAAAPLIAISIAAFVIQSYQVDGQSMETTLHHNDRLIVDKFPRTWARITKNDYVPKRGEIIIFNQSGLDFTSNSPKQLIKRVIGLPGERVKISGGKITVFNSQNPNGFNPDTSGIYRMESTNTSGEVDQTLKDDEIFVAGDNRSNSEDSRYFGPVQLKQIVGKLAFRIIPLNDAQKF